jgi:hypothetical protein
VVVVGALRPAAGTVIAYHCLVSDTLPVPTSSAAPARFGSDGDPSLASIATGVAEELEGTRRTITLGGSLLLIPTSVMVMVGAGGMIGAGPGLLALFAMVGLASGPAACFLALGLSNLVGTPLVKRAFLRRAQAMGISPQDAEAAWAQATQSLDAAARERLLSPGRAAS